MLLIATLYNRYYGQVKGSQHFLTLIKGQIKPKAGVARLKFSKKKERTNLFCLLFCFFLANKQIHSFNFGDDRGRFQTALGFIWPVVLKTCLGRVKGVKNPEISLHNICRYWYQLWMCVSLPASLEIYICARYINTQHIHPNGMWLLDLMQKNRLFQKCNLHMYIHWSNYLKLNFPPIW